MKSAEDRTAPMVFEDSGIRFLVCKCGLTVSLGTLARSGKKCPACARAHEFDDALAVAPVVSEEARARIEKRTAEYLAASAGARPGVGSFAADFGAALAERPASALQLEIPASPEPSKNAKRSFRICPAGVLEALPGQPACGECGARVSETSLGLFWPCGHPPSMAEREALRINLDPEIRARARAIDSHTVEVRELESGPRGDWISTRDDPPMRTRVEALEAMKAAQAKKAGKPAEPAEEPKSGERHSGTVSRSPGLPGKNETEWRDPSEQKAPPAPPAEASAPKKTEGEKPQVSAPSGVEPVTPRSAGAAGSGDASPAGAPKVPASSPALETSAKLAAEIAGADVAERKKRILDERPIFESAQGGQKTQRREQFERVVETVYDLDIEKEAKALESFAMPNEQLGDRGTHRARVNAAEDNARRAFRLYLAAKGEGERVEHELEPIIEAMREDAMAQLQAEKDAKKRSKAITKGDVEGLAAKLYSDEWYDSQQRLSRAKGLVKYFERLAELWWTRCQGERSMLDSSR